MSGHDASKQTSSDLHSFDENAAAELLSSLLGSDDGGQISHPPYPIQDDNLPYEYYNNDVVTSPESGFASDSAATMPSPEYACLDDAESSGRPYLRIIEEPEELFRFRYLKEAKVPHGPICGCRSGQKLGTSRKKTDSGPKVKLFNFSGEAVIRCWLTLPGTSQPHVHQLVVTGKKVSDETREPHAIKVNASNDYTASFDKLNIIHAVTENSDDQKDYWRRKHLIGAGFNGCVQNITTPFRTDEMRKEIKNAEKNLASLYFEAFAFVHGEYIRICEPVKSRGIRNTKNPQWNVLKIYKHLPSQGSCEGNDEAILLVDKTVKAVKIRFFELNDAGEEIWSTDVIPDEIHKQVAIVFRTPPFRTKDIDRPVVVNFKIMRNDDESPPKKFIYTPSTRCMLGKKRRIMDEVDSSLFESILKQENVVNFENFPSAESSSYRSLNDINMSFPSTSTLPFAPMDVVPPVLLPNFNACKTDTSLCDNVEGDGDRIDKSPMPDLIGKVPMNAVNEAKQESETSRIAFFMRRNKMNVPLLRRNGDNTLTEKRPMKSIENQISFMPNREGPVEDEHSEPCRCRYWSDDKLPLCHQMLYNGEIKRWHDLPSGIEDSLEEYNHAGETVLLTAIKLNDVESVDKLLKLRPSCITQRTLTGDDGPFHVAVKSRRRQIIATLKNLRFDWNQVNGSNLTPLHYAVSFGDEDLIKLLLSSSGVDIGLKLGEWTEFDDDDVSSDDEYDTDGPEILKGPVLNKFAPDKKIYDLLLALSTPKARVRVTIEDLQAGRTVGSETVCLKLAEALNLQFLRVVGSKQPFNIIKSYLEAKVGPEEAAIKIERALSALSIND